MRQIMTFGVAAVLGAMAFGLNSIYLRARSEPGRYVAVKQDLRAGQQITTADLEPIQLSGDAVTPAVPYVEIDTVLGRVAPRDMKRGELVLWQDIRPDTGSLRLNPGEQGLHLSVRNLRIQPGLLRVEDWVGFVVPDNNSGDSAISLYERIGPYRVVGINAETTADADLGDRRREMSVDTLTVAVQPNSDGQLGTDVSRLVEANADSQIAGLMLVGTDGQQRIATAPQP